MLAECVCSLLGAKLLYEERGMSVEAVFGDDNLLEVILSDVFVDSPRLSLVCSSFRDLLRQHAFILRRVAFVLERLVVSRVVQVSAVEEATESHLWECIACDSAADTAGGGCQSCGGPLVPRSLSGSEQTEYARHVYRFYDGDDGAWHEAAGSW